MAVDVNQELFQRDEMPHIFESGGPSQSELRVLPAIDVRARAGINCTIKAISGEELIALFLRGPLKLGRERGPANVHSAQSSIPQPPTRVMHARSF